MKDIFFSHAQTCQHLVLRLRHRLRHHPRYHRYGHHPRRHHHHALHSLRQVLRPLLDLLAHQHFPLRLRVHPHLSPPAPHLKSVYVRR